MKKTKNVYQRIRKGGKASTVVKKLPTHEEKEEDHHVSSLAQLHHLMTKAKIKQNIVKKKRVKPMMTGTTMFESIMVLSVV